MERFTRLFEELDSTTSTQAKVRSLQVYFETAPPADQVWALYLLMGKTRRRLVTARLLRQVFLRVSGMAEWLFDECYAQVGDSAEVITLLLADLPLTPTHPPPLALHQWMETILPQARATSDEAEGQDLILAWWSALPPDQVFVLNKILTGAFRCGVSEQLVLQGFAAASGLDRALLAHRLIGDFTPNLAFYAHLTSPETGLVHASQPYPFFLASPLDPDRFTPECFSQWRAEWKWDGIRAQILRRADQVFIWSRGEELITPQFPEIAAALEEWPNGLVMDGELLCWQQDRPLPFHHLQKRLGRKQVGKRLLADHPVHFIAYDLLEQEGQDLRPYPLGDRQQRLAQLLQRYPHPHLHYCHSFGFQSLAELTAHRDQARHRGAEGVVIKAVDSPYLVGRKRGYWWKYKVDPMSLDGVLIYAQAGRGKRANLFTDYTFALWQGTELVPFAKAYSGLDNREIKALDSWIRRHTLERFGPVRSVEPLQVFEIGFEGIAASPRHKSGISVRFPRILRWRQDKHPSAADRMETARALMLSAEERPEDL
ncbi:MAG: ATP-dependent DNA ligase [Nodosilinea sp.]